MHEKTPASDGIVVPGPIWKYIRALIARTDPRTSSRIQTPADLAAWIERQTGRAELYAEENRNHD